MEVHTMRRLIVLTGILTSMSGAQGEPAADSDKPAEVVVHFHDGSVVRRVMVQDRLEVTTRFGKLTVPFAEVLRIEFGLHVTEETAKKRDEALKDLASDNFQRRQAGSDTLLSLGRFAYPSLLALTRDKDLETTRRAEGLLERIRETVPAEQLELRAEDVVRTKDCTLTGRIQTTTLRGRAESLGDVHLNLAELRFVQAAGCEARVVVGTKYMRDDAWLDTGFQVGADLDLVIENSGGLNGPPATPVALLPASAPRPFSPGTLIGRIGEKGEPFAINDQYRERPKQQGKLFLRIAPVPGAKDEAGWSGAYKVKVMIDFDRAPERTSGWQQTAPATLAARHEGARW
jgi:hypothetical protein